MKSTGFLFLSLPFWGSLFAGELHVAVGGNDANPGTAEKPFATLERARNEIRALRKAGASPEGGGIIVSLHAGRYELATPLTLGAEDAGTKSSPTLYRAWPGDEVQLSGGKQIANWQIVSDPTELVRLDPAAHGQVYRADLRALGVTEFGQMGGGFGLREGPGLELFFQGKPMTISRFPNEGFIAITGVEGTTEVKWGNRSGVAEGVFTCESDRLGRWTQEKDARVLGYWFHDWAEQRQRIESIDVTARRITLAKPYHHYGYRAGQWFYAFNLLCEIDQPGEWCLDRQAGVLYFWPPSPIASGNAVVSILENLIVMNDAAHVAIRGLDLEHVRGTAVVIEGALENQIAGCTVRNVGGWAVNLKGEKSSVSGCEIDATGDGGISLGGGDRSTLTPAGLLAENNHIHHWSRWNRMNRQGIALSGVGNRAAHNLLHDAPHTAIYFHGNDHLIEFNEIHHVCSESNDAGAIYAGRDWTMRGTVIRHNYLHHLSGFEGRGCIGIYLDDLFSGTLISGNVFYEVPRAAYIGGGRDNRIEFNLFVDCDPAVHVDSRGLGWAHRWPTEWIAEIREKRTLSGVRYDQPPFSERYPDLPRLLERDPAAPFGSVIAHNLRVGGTWSGVDKKAEPYVTFTDNIQDLDPGFVDAAKANFQLREDFPAYRRGFKPIPTGEIGLRREGRASTDSGK